MLEHTNQLLRLLIEEQHMMKINKFQSLSFSPLMYEYQTAATARTSIISTTAPIQHQSPSLLFHIFLSFNLTIIVIKKKEKKNPTITLPAAYLIVPIVAPASSITIFAPRFDHSIIIIKKKKKIINDPNPSRHCVS